MSPVPTHLVTKGESSCDSIAISCCMSSISSSAFSRSMTWFGPVDVVGQLAANQERPPDALRDTPCIN